METSDTAEDLAAFGDLLAWRAAGEGRSYELSGDAAGTSVMLRGDDGPEFCYAPTVRAAVRDALAAWGN